MGSLREVVEVVLLLGVVLGVLGMLVRVVRVVVGVMVVWVMMRVSRRVVMLVQREPIHSSHRSATTAGSATAGRQLGARSTNTAAAGRTTTTTTTRSTAAASNAGDRRRRPSLQALHREPAQLTNVTAQKAL